MTHYDDNHPLTIPQMKQLFKEHSAEIQKEADRCPSDMFPQLRISLPDCFPLDEEVYLRFLRTDYGYALQFSEELLYSGRNHKLSQLALGNPVPFDSWPELEEFISNLPNDFGGSEDYSSDGTQYVISSDGHAIEQDYADAVRLEDLIDKLKIQPPEHSFSHPNESTILEELRKNIRGQPMATATIAHLVHAHLCKKDPQRPLSFLLHGQPGTGKTESAKVLARILERYCEPEYGYSMTQLNTFTESHTISRLLGAEPGYVGYEEKGVFETVVDNPYMVYCFDEIEKAHPVILKAFMSILDDGVLASRKELDDGSREFNFKHCIFVFTSNLKLNSSTPKIGFCTDSEIKDISASKKGIAVSYEAKPKAADPELVQTIYSNNEKARAAFVRTGVLTEIASRFGCFVEFQPLSETAKLEILARTVLHIGFEYGIKLSKIDNAIMQELVNSVSAENGLTVRSFRTVIEGYLASAFAATAGLSDGDSGTYRLGGTLANPVLKQV